MLSEADINAVVKALIRKHKISRAEAYQFVVSYAMETGCRSLTDISKELKRGMERVVDTIDSCKFGVDVARMDPLFRKVAKGEPHLNIRFENCTDLARQLEECRRRENVK